MTTDPLVSRRTALAGGLAGAGALTLAACSSSSSSDKKSEPSGSTASGGPQTVATLADIKVGDSISATVDGKDVLVSRPSANSVKCFSAICTHQGCTVKPAGKQLDCPCHGSVYDAATGKVLQGPAPSPLKEIPVQVQGGKVVTTGAA